MTQCKPKYHIGVKGLAQVPEPWDLEGREGSVGDLLLLRSREALWIPGDSDTGEASLIGLLTSPSRPRLVLHAWCVLPRFKFLLSMGEQRAVGKSKNGLLMWCEFLHLGIFGRSRFLLLLLRKGSGNKIYGYTACQS